MTVVVGHDGSDSGDDAAVLGARLARAKGEGLLVVTVYPEENPIGIGRVDAEWVEAMREHAREVSDCAKRFLDERAIAAELRLVGSGSAAHGLDDVAEAEHASLIVVGSERHGARRRISPGSTGERLLHGAICPVAIAPRGFRERPTDSPVERIGVSFVDTPEAHEALRFAAELAKETSAKLTLYTVIARRAEVFSPVIGRDAEEAFLATVREDVHAAQDKALAALPEGVEATEELLEGDTVDALAALDEHEIDLLVCGSRGYGPVRRVLLGGVLRKLVRRAACPVVVVPRGAA
ncbi:universal stress protein [Solirubrobacter ginsenosidimutans]|uniref:Universal stress protein n=1 Tax=Solirubrobacter ginsenosidimutans TaxID=490573 RepID=A0A9X3N5V8_9ACTN|nr:universal stress protein [Solirubrobacter ginsenosidimutans]MDA0167107.1 universal stress protein [Solirubrobacter ginsenosidimutans]